MKNKLIVLMFLSTASIFAQVPSYVPSSGLVGWWPFNGNAQDESGNGNHGTVNGATLTSDRGVIPNTAYSFDGVDDYIKVQNSPNILTQEYSVSIWFYSNTDYSTGNNNTLLRSGDAGVCNGVGFAIANFDFKTKFGFSDFGSGNFCFKTSINCSSFQTGKWHNLIFTRNSNKGIQYLNGIAMDSLTNNSYSPATNCPIFFGSNWLNTGDIPWDVFNGKIDDIGIWNRALTQQEITALYEGCNLNAAISPASSQVATGASAQFSTPAAAGTSYQWQSNPAAYGWSNVPSNSTYAGGSNNTLTINNVQLANHLQPFRVIATKGNCVDTSSVAFIEVLDTCITQDTLLTTVTDTLIIHTTLGLAQNGIMNTIRIYPNPASDYLIIDNGNHALMAGYSIQIKNNTGQQVFQSAINQAQFTVDLSSWTGDGLYFVHILDPQGATVTIRKIILQ